MPDHYSSWVGLVYVFNLIVGTGALTLPAVFSGAGWLLSTILIILMCLVSFITVTYVLESMANANAYLYKERIETHKIDEHDLLLANEELVLDGRLYHLNNSVELGQMANLFFNRAGRFFFYCSLCTYLFGDLAIYITAICKTLVDLACANTTEDYTVQCDLLNFTNFNKITVYRLCIGLFTVTVAPFAYCKVQKTKYLQILTTALRWSAFILMISIAVGHLVNSGPKNQPDPVKFTGIPSLIGAGIYSFMCHHSLPGLIAPITGSKTGIYRKLALDYILICGFYLLLALTGTFAFAHLDDLYTLNFIPTTDGVTTPLLLIVKYFLSLFPVFTLATSFPIIAITLQNNIRNLFGSRFAQAQTVKYLFPTLAIAPPICVAIWTHNLKALVAVTGAYAGLCIQYVIPVFHVLYARKYGANTGNDRNRFCSPFRHWIWTVFVLVWTGFTVVFVTVNLTSNT